MTLKKGTIISIHELLRLPATPLSLALWLFCLRVTVIGMANLLDDFQSDSRADEEKKCIFIARGGLTGRTVKVFLTYLKAKLFSWSKELFTHQIK